MTTRAKFTCVGVTKNLHWNASNPNKFLYTAEFNPVYSGSEENKRFFEASPSGNIKLGQFVEDRFQPGKSYYIDFIEAEN